MTKKAIGYKDSDGNYGFKFTEDGRIYLGNTADDIVSVTGTLDVNGNMNIYNDVVVRNTTYGYDSSATHYQENFEGLSDGSTTDPSTNGTWTNGLGSENGTDIVNGYAWIAEDTDGNSTSTGPDNAHSGSIYVFTEASSRNNKYYTLQRSFTADQSRVISKLSLYYHMYGSNMGSLSVYASGSYANSGGWVQLDITRDADGSPATASTISGQQHSAEDEAYKRAEVDLETYSGTAFSLRIVGLTGGGYPSDLAIDAIEFIPRQVTLNVSPTNISASVPFSGSTFSANSFHGSFYGSGTGLTSIPAGSLASDCVETAKILDSNVTTAKIADDAVTAAKIDSAASPTVAGLTLTGDLNVDSGTLFVDTSDNDVRIGTTTAVSAEKLMVRQSSRGENTGIMLSYGTSAGDEYLSLDIESADTAMITAGAISTGDCALAFRTSDSSEAERMRINKSGLVGIGTTSPNAGLHIDISGEPQLLLDGGDDSHGDIVVPDGEKLQIGHWNDGSDTYSARLTVETDGSVTIPGDLTVNGTSTATNAENVDVDSTGANASYRVVLADASGTGYEQLYVDNADSLTFNPSSNLLTTGDMTVEDELFVNDYARIDALRVGTTSTDPGDGNLYVEGDITLNGGDITVPQNDFNVNSYGNINLKLDTNNNSTNYLNIKNGAGTTVAQFEETGRLVIDRTSATSTPAVEVDCANNDITLLRADSETAGGYGFNIRYLGTGTGDENRFALTMDNQAGTDINAILVDQDGDVTIPEELTVNKRVYLDRSDTGHPLGIKANSSSGYGWYLKEDDASDYWSCRYHTTHNRLQFVWQDGTPPSDGHGSGGYVQTLSYEGVPVEMYMNAISFTGQHRCLVEDENVTTQEFANHVGKIVSSTGKYTNFATDENRHKPNINQAVPTIELTTTRKQKTCVGVVSNIEDPNEEREYVNGAFVSMMGEIPSGDDRVYINSLGEGAIWITNINGNIENGDYITTCEIPGYGMKQDDDLLHNYTVAKITQDCLFDLNSTTYECEEIQHNGQTYKAAFVGCTYHCG
jgi:hypothetical protein